MIANECCHFANHPAVHSHHSIKLKSVLHLQADREAAESQAAELTAEVERMRKQAEAAADDFTSSLEAARHKALVELQRTQVRLLGSLCE